MKRIFTAVVIAVGLSVCSVAVAVAAVSLNGTYKTTIQSTVLGGALNGTWTVKLKNDKYHVADNGHPIVHGTYTIKGNKIRLKDTGGEGKCPGHRRLQVQGERDDGHVHEGARSGRGLHRPSDRADLCSLDEGELSPTEVVTRAGYPAGSVTTCWVIRPRRSTSDRCPCSVSV